METKIKQTLLFAVLSASLFSTSGALASSASDFVGGWYGPGAGGVGLGGVITFLNDGTYYLASDADASYPVDMERGTYNWNASTGSMTMSSIIDLDSPPYTDTFSAQVNGNTMTALGGNSTRVINPSNPLVGSWDGIAAGSVVMTFLSNGTYFLADDGNPIFDATGQKGIEIGSYTWDQNTGAFSSSCPMVNTDGEWGLSHSQPKQPGVDGCTGSMTTMMVNGNTLTATFDTGVFTATRVTAVPVPAAAWLLGSGLLGLVGMARRKAA